MIDKGYIVSQLNPRETLNFGHKIFRMVAMAIVYLTT